MRDHDCRSCVIEWLESENGRAWTRETHVPKSLLVTVVDDENPKDELVAILFYGRFDTEEQMAEDLIGDSVYAPF